MPKKYLRKFLPHHDTVRTHRAVRWLGPLLHHHNLWHLNRHSAAGGVAVGLAAGLIPLPIQMLTAAIGAILFRVNLPVAVVATLYTNPFTMVPIYVAVYAVGDALVGHGTAPATHFEFQWGITEWWRVFPAFVDWIVGLGPAFLVGMGVCAALLSVTGFVLVHLGWRLYLVLAWRRRARRRRAQAD